MESRNLTELHHYSTKEGTNRYSIQRVVYPQNIYASSLVQEETLSQNRDSTDDETCIEGECFVYIAGFQIFTIEIKQPDFFHQQLCIDLSKNQHPLECLTAFPLPQGFQNSQHILPLSTGILVLRNVNNTQQLNLYDDISKEINIEFAIPKRIIWMNSRNLQDKVILIFGFNDSSVGVYYIEFVKKGVSQIKFIKEFQYEQLIIFNDIFTHNSVFHIALTSYNGVISMFHVDLEYHIIDHHVHSISRITSPPKFYLHQNTVHLMVPIQNGQMLQYVNTQNNGLQNYNIIKYQNNNKSMITAFDIEPKKSDSRFEQCDEFEVCIIHFDGTLSLYDFIENNLYIEISKQLNGSRFYISNMQLQFKQFILMGSDDDIEIYQMSFYHIN